MQCLPSPLYRQEEDARHHWTSGKIQETSRKGGREKNSQESQKRKNGKDQSRNQEKSFQKEGQKIISQKCRERRNAFLFVFLANKKGLTNAV